MAGDTVVLCVTRHHHGTPVHAMICRPIESLQGPQFQGKKISAVGFQMGDPETSCFFNLEDKKRL